VKKRGRKGKGEKRGKRVGDGRDLAHPKILVCRRPHASVVCMRREFLANVDSAELVMALVLSPKFWPCIRWPC